MIICPVCEHQQAQGTECDNCGKQFVATKTPDLPVTALPELEGTAIAGANAPAPVAKLAELEETKLQSGPDLPAMAVPDLDLARAAPVQVAPEVVADLEGHRIETNPAELTPAPSGAITCRYCRNVQAEGSVCNVCGMRLPRYAAAGADPYANAKADQLPQIRHACGVLTRVGAPCKSCGVFVPIPSAS